MGLRRQPAPAAHGGAGYTSGAAWQPARVARRAHRCGRPAAGLQRKRVEGAGVGVCQIAWWLCGGPLGAAAKGQRSYVCAPLLTWYRQMMAKKRVMEPMTISIAMSKP